jgi:hypothetical protein
VQWFSFNAGAGEYKVAGQITAADSSGTGTLTEGSKRIESVAMSSGAFVVGQSISGVGIPAGSTVTGVGPEPFVIEISNPVEKSAEPVRTLVPLTAEQPLHEPRAVAVDNSSGPSAGDVYVSSEVAGAEVVDKFTAEGVFVGQISRTSSTAPAFALVQGLAVDPAGTLWLLETSAGTENVDRFGGAVVNEFEGSCVAPAQSTFGLAVDAHDNLYVPNNAGDVVEIDSGCKILNPSVGGGSPGAGAGVTRYGGAVEVSSGEAYVDNVETVGRFTSDGSEVERFGAGNLASEGCGFVRVTCLGGLAVSSATGEVFAAVGSPARVAVFALEEPAPPKIENEAVSAVSDDTATLEAEINPRSLTGEAPTEYHFEYGPCPGASATCPASGYPSKASGSLPPGFGVQSVDAPLPGLQAGTTYHFRLIASNGHGPAQGVERIFTTEGTGEFTLPDGRQWEMVSPAAMHGALVAPLGDTGGLAFGAPTQAAAGGGAITYAANAPTESEPVGTAIVQQVLSRRGPSGWSSQDISVPHNASTGAAANDEEVRFFSEDLSLAIVQPLRSFIPLSEDASEQTAYLRDSQSGAFTPLVTGCPAAPAACDPAVEEHADVPDGTTFGQLTFGGGSCLSGGYPCGPEFLGATPDLKHVVLIAHALLEPGSNEESLYEWNKEAPATERLQLISLLPPNGEGKELPAVNPKLGVFTSSVLEPRTGSISADGSHVFFSAESHLYMRDTVAHKTIQIDAPEQECLQEKTCGGGVVGPTFQFASSSGNRVFFTDKQKLTSNGGEYHSEENAAGDLYVCELHENACALTDLAPSGAVLGQMSGASEDGSWVYFAANAALAPGAVSGGCPNGASSEKPVSGSTCNLYVEHLEAGVWGQPRVVATLSGNDQLDWGSVRDHLVARVSPSGRWLAFMSQQPLTGYDNRDAVSGQRDQEVYVYDAEGERLNCVSCDPSGARPHGVEYGANGQNVPLLGNAGWRETQWLAGSVPAWVQYRGNEALYQPRYLGDSGRLFFDSHDALVPKDVNGAGDVYEFEPVGEGACTEGTSSGGSTFVPGERGCVGLISSGSSAEESALLDASETGGDVFFISTAKLSPLDVEGGRTVYDAHECTGSSPCPPLPAGAPAPCITEASCKAAPSPQPAIYGPPASATFSGPGNIAPVITSPKVAKKSVKCKKGFVKNKKGRCLKRKKSKKAKRTKAKKSGRAGNNRGAGR